jgi:hypothetical protein
VDSVWWQALWLRWWTFWLWRHWVSAFLKLAVAFNRDCLENSLLINRYTTQNIYITSVTTFSASLGSSVSIVSGYGLDERAIEVRSPADARGFFL